MTSNGCAKYILFKMIYVCFYKSHCKVAFLLVTYVSQWAIYAEMCMLKDDGTVIWIQFLWSDGKLIFMTFQTLSSLTDTKQRHLCYLSLSIWTTVFSCFIQYCTFTPSVCLFFFCHTKEEIETIEHHLVWNAKSGLWPIWNLCFFGVW